MALFHVAQILCHAIGAVAIANTGSTSCSVRVVGGNPDKARPSRTRQGLHRSLVAAGVWSLFLGLYLSYCTSKQVVHHPISRSQVGEPTRASSNATLQGPQLALVFRRNYNQM